MKLSVFSPALADRNLEEACAFLHAQGVQAMEVGCGGYPGKAHCNPEVLLNDSKALENFKDTFKKNELEIAALSTHGNPVHPDKAEAAHYESDFRNAVLLAEKLGIDRIICFSGCPGGCKDDKMPNWATCAWPPEYLQVLDYQWNDVLIPYWTKTCAWAKEHGIKKIAFEMHPGFCVYNPETMLKIRAAVGDMLGANLDPSHLFWQCIDPVEAIRYLGNAIYFFHAKDTYIDSFNTARNGVLDTKHYSDAQNRSWIFRTVGYGHDMATWKAIMSQLRIAGYDDVISIEHEDGLMTGNEGLVKAIRFMQNVMMFEGIGDMFWA